MDTKHTINSKAFFTLISLSYIHSHTIMTSVYLFLFLKKFFMDVELIYNVVLISAIQWSDSAIHRYTCFFNILFHYCLSLDIEYTSLCYTVGPCCLPILCIIAYICSSQTPGPSLPQPLPLDNHQSISLSFYIMSLRTSIFITSFSWAYSLQFTDDNNS